MGVKFWQQILCNLDVWVGMVFLSTHKDPYLVDLDRCFPRNAAL